MDRCAYLGDHSCETNWGQKFFIMLGLIPVAVVVPAWIVVQLVWLPMKRRADKRLREFIGPPPYERLYPIAKAVQEREDTDSIERNVVIDSTPDGLVQMRYSAAEEGFEYWSNGGIKYKYLETVARKYVTFFACKDLYVDRRALLRKKLVRLRREISENEAKSSDEDCSGETVAEETSVFATFKDYNTVKKNVVKTKITRDDYTVDSANKYIRRGKVADAFFQKKKEDGAESTSKLSFGEWSSSLFS